MCQEYDMLKICIKDFVHELLKMDFQDQISNVENVSPILFRKENDI